MLLRKLIIQCFRDVCDFDINNSFHLKFVFQKDSAKKYRLKSKSRGFFPNQEKEMATHSSTLAWKIPWTEEPGRLQSMGSQS